MANSRPKPGDVVELKSGGPEMTVSHPDGRFPFLVNCFWYDSKAHQMNNMLVALDALKIIKSE